MVTVCMYCEKDLSKYNLDFKRDIVCDRCTQGLVGGKNLPQKRPERRSKRQSIQMEGKHT